MSTKIVDLHAESPVHHTLTDDLSGVVTKTKNYLMPNVTFKSVKTYLYFLS